MIQVFEITLLFLGSVIGAGFATGAEIITFFGRLNLPVWCIAIIVSLTMFGIIALEITLYYPKTNPRELIIVSQKKNLFNQASDFCSILIYFILFTAMTAGVTAISNSTLTIISLILSIVIVFFGFEKLSKLNILLVLIIIILIISTALPWISVSNLVNKNTITWVHIPKGVFSAFLYAGLNCFMFPELIKAVGKKHTKKTLISAAILTALILMILVGLILTTIQNAQTTMATIPLLAAAPNIITIIIILLAILTSQYTALFAISHRCQNQQTPNVKKNRPLIKMIGICAIAYAISFCGFNKIINFAYPLIGAFTCFFLIFSWLRSQLQHEILR